VCYAGRAVVGVGIVSLAMVLRTMFMLTCAFMLSVHGPSCPLVGVVGGGRVCREGVVGWQQDERWARTTTTMFGPQVVPGGRQAVPACKEGVQVVRCVCPACCPQCRQRAYRHRWRKRWEVAGQERENGLMSAGQAGNGVRPCPEQVVWVLLHEKGEMNRK